MITTAKEMRAKLQRLADDMFVTQIVAGRRIIEDDDGNEHIVEFYKDVPALTYKLPKETLEVDPRSQAVNFLYDGTQVVTVDGERIILSQGPRTSLLEKYRLDADSEMDIVYDENEYKLRRNYIAFANAIGIDITPDI